MVYVGVTFILFKLNVHLKCFQDFLSSCHINMSFSLETEKKNYVEVMCEQDIFTTTLYRTSTFSGRYSNFERILPAVYKFGTIYNLVYRCFCICSDWS